MVIPVSPTQSDPHQPDVTRAKSPLPLSGGKATAKKLARPERTAATQTGRTAKVRTREFPEQPLISTRPLRYNVQLNEQITAVQQADSYLRRTETLLLRLRHSLNSSASGMNNGITHKSVAENVANLEQLLSRRKELSAGTVNRQLTVSLEGRSEVRFTLKEGAALENDHSETLLFSLAGERRELVAIRLAANSSNRQIVRQLNQGLGRWGVYATLDEKQRVTFSVTETQWERVSTQLSVCGEGHRYPAGQFYPLSVQEEPGMVEILRNIAQNSRQTHSYSKEFDQALEQITQQRQTLAQSQHRVEQRLSSISTYKEVATAETASRRLSQKLISADKSYAALSQALGAQANLRAFVVRSVL